MKILVEPGGGIKESETGFDASLDWLDESADMPRRLIRGNHKTLETATAARLDLASALCDCVSCFVGPGGALRSLLQQTGCVMGTVLDTLSTSRTLIVVVTIAFVLGFTGCGTTKVKDASQVAASGDAMGHGDKDLDARHGHFYDVDDREVKDFGVAAGEGARKEIALLVRRYYAAARVEDGSVGCSLLYSLFVESVTEQHGEETRDTTVGGTTCRDIVANVFKKNHGALSGEAAKLHLLEARVEGPRGYVLLDTGLGHPVFMYLHKDAARWKLESLLAEEFG